MMVAPVALAVLGAVLFAFALDARATAPHARPTWLFRYPSEIGVNPRLDIRGLEAGAEVHSGIPVVLTSSSIGQEGAGRVGYVWLNVRVKVAFKAGKLVRTVIPEKKYCWREIGTGALCNKSHSTPIEKAAPIAAARAADGTPWYVQGLASEFLGLDEPHRPWWDQGGVRGGPLTANSGVGYESIYPRNNGASFFSWRWDVDRWGRIGPDRSGLPSSTPVQIPDGSGGLSSGFFRACSTATRTLVISDWGYQVGFNNPDYSEFDGFSSGEFLGDCRTLPAGAVYADTGSVRQGSNWVPALAVFRFTNAGELVDQSTLSPPSSHDDYSFLVGGSHYYVVWFDHNGSELTGVYYQTSSDQGQSWTPLEPLPQPWPAPTSRNLAEGQVQIAPLTVLPDGRLAFLQTNRRAATLWRYPLPDGHPSTAFDTTAPDTEITSRPPATTSGRLAEFAFTASEPVATFYCQLLTPDSDGLKSRYDRFMPCRSPLRTRQLAPGTYRFRVYAVDLAGNRDQDPAVAKFTVR